MKQWMGRLCLWVGLAGVAGLAACGGGGGGGSGGGSASPPAAQPPAPPAPPAPTTSGFVPAAGVAGEVLAAQAVQVRPVHAGLRAHFRRVDFQPTGALSRQDLWRRQSAAPQGGVFEGQRGDAFDKQTLTVDGTGQVKLATDLALPGGAAPLRIEGFELMSPVRANQQIVTVDRRIEGSTVDVDKDGKGDTLELALWRTVIGFEAVTLPRVAQSVRAIRVDSEARVRLTPSGGGIASQSRQRWRTWYAEGVGVVKEQELDEAGQVLAEELLLGFDGGDRGLGALVANDPFGTANPFVKPGADQEIVGEVAPQMGFNRFGKLFETALRESLGLGANRAWRLASGGVAVNSASMTVRVRSLDRQWAYAGDAPIELSLLGPSPAQFWQSEPMRFVASPGATVGWVVWERRLWADIAQGWWVARAFNASGWVGAEQLVPQDAQAGSLSAVPKGDALALTWTQGTPQSQHRLHTALLSPQSAPVIAQWRDDVPNLNGFFEAQLLNDGSNQWLTWLRSVNGRLESFAMRLDARLQPVGMPSTWEALQAAALLPQPTVEDGNQLLEQQRWASDGGWWQVLRQWGRAHPEDLPAHFLELRLLDPGPAAPAGALREQRRIRLEFGEGLAAPPMAFPQHWLLLVLTDQGRTTVPVVVWR